MFSSRPRSLRPSPPPTVRARARGVKRARIAAEKAIGVFEKPKPAPRDMRAWARAREKARKILETHNPEYLDPAATWRSGSGSGLYYPEFGGRRLVVAQNAELPGEPGHLAQCRLDAIRRDQRAQDSRGAARQGAQHVAPRVQRQGA